MTSATLGDSIAAHIYLKSPIQRTCIILSCSMTLIYSYVFYFLLPPYNYIIIIVNAVIGVGCAICVAKAQQLALVISSVLQIVLFLTAIIVASYGISAVTDQDTCQSVRFSPSQCKLYGQSSYFCWLCGQIPGLITIAVVMAFCALIPAVFLLVGLIQIIRLKRGHKLSSDSPSRENVERPDELEVPRIIPVGNNQFVVRYGNNIIPLTPNQSPIVEQTRPNVLPHPYMAPYSEAPPSYEDVSPTTNVTPPITSSVAPTSSGSDVEEDDGNVECGELSREHEDLKLNDPDTMYLKQFQI